MRLMLWSLLALNGVAAALWLAGVTVPAASRPAAPPPALAAKRLELLSELPSPPPRIGAQDDALPQSPAPALSQSAPAAAEGAAPPGDAPQATKVEDDPDTAVAVPPVDDGVAPAPPAPSASSAPPSAGATEPAALPPAPKPEPTPESTPIKPAATAVPAPATVAAPATPSGTSRAAAGTPDGVACYRTAEFAPDARERIAGALQTAGLAPADLKSSLRPRYWVYWRGAPGAVAKVEQALKSGGVKDWYRVGATPDVIISLGVYGQAEGARRRQRELAAKGVEATVAERYAQAARQRWQVKASAASVESARATLVGAGVRLEACP
ncbi:MAG: hypothetical protein AB7N69_07630 [Immundisolibacter sp.]|uniref:hypothetical protein n=1 Tax=Immundisolibacter sp. TaxID=1934948 RepID=UPI003D0B0324